MKRELPRGVTKRELRNEKRGKGIAAHFHVGTTAVGMACGRAEVQGRRDHGGRHDTDAFSVREETALALCKGDGRSTLTLRGFSRSLYVSAPCYESKSVRLWEINPAEELLIGLEPLASQ